VEGVGVTRHRTFEFVFINGIARVRVPTRLEDHRTAESNISEELVGGGAVFRVI
jgi:hypothetical protein